MPRGLAECRGVSAACFQSERLWPVLGREPFLRPWWVEAGPFPVLSFESSCRGSEVPDEA